MGIKNSGRPDKFIPLGVTAILVAITVLRNPTTSPRNQTLNEQNIWNDHAKAQAQPHGCHRFGEPLPF